MNSTEVARRYHEAWNGRDADTLRATFTKDGTFCNPDTYPGVSAEALAAYVKGLWAAFPDFHLELLNAGEIESGLVAHHWMVKGTNTGKGADGSEPTGRAIAVKGASIIKVEGDKVVSDQCYFDRVALIEQLQEQRKAPIESLRSQAESLGLSMHKSDSEGLYYLAKEEPVSGESRRIGPDMGPDDIAGFLTEEIAVRAALRPTYWLAEVAANIDRPYKSDTVSVIVEVVAKDADAPELAYEQASRFVATNYGATAGIPAKKPCAVPAQKPDRNPDGHSPEPLSCPVWIVRPKS